MVILLLGQVVDIDAQNNRGETPLHMAAMAGRLEMVRLLLTKGVQTNAKDNDDYTPLHWSLEHGYAEIASLLIGGTDRRLKD